MSADLRGAGSGTDPGPSAATEGEDVSSHRRTVEQQVKPGSHHEFKDEGQRVGGVDDVVEQDHVGVFQTFEQRSCKQNTR